MTVENQDAPGEEVAPAPAEARALRLLPRNGKKGWYEVRNAVNGAAEISIHDEIGGWGVTAKDFIDEVRALGTVAGLNVHINSPGGSVFEGLAIYNFLKRLDNVTVYVDGLAASIASVIAMAGRVVMPENAMLMIHDPSLLAMGTAAELRAAADALDKVKASLVTVYTAKSGKEAGEIEAVMSAETWLTAAEAVEMGFADELVAPVKMAASFDVSRFENAPDAVKALAEPEADEVVTLDLSEPETVEDVAVPEAPERDYHAEAVEIAEICATAGAPAAEHIAAKASPADVRARLDAIGTIRDMCARAKAPAMFDGLKNKTVDEAREALFDHIVSNQSPEIATYQPADPANTSKPAINTAEIYANRRKLARNTKR